MERKVWRFRINSTWKFQIRATMSNKMAALKSFYEITQKSPFNSQYSYKCSLGSEKISGIWKPLKNHEKYFLFHLNKLNLLLANQILLILCIFIKPNVWYSRSLKNFFFSIWVWKYLTLCSYHVTYAFQSESTL